MRLKNVSIEGFRSIQELHSLDLGSPTVLAGRNDAGKSAIIHAILFFLGGYSLTESDRTYLTDAEDGNSSPATDGKVPRVPNTCVSGLLTLNEAEVGEFGLETLEVRRISYGGTKAVLEVRQSVAEDLRLRDFESLLVPQLMDRLKTLGLDVSKARKAEYLERLRDAAASGPQLIEWASAPQGLDRALPSARRFDATSAVDAEVAIKDTLATAYKTHLSSETLQGSVRKIEADLETRLVKDASDIRQHIMKKVSDIGDVRISPSVSFTSANGLKSTDISVTNAAGEDINLQYSGAGRARRVALAIWEYNATLLAQSGDDVVLLYDEPDTHLDYAHQRELMALIHEQTRNPKVTVVIASHSMNLVDGTDISDVVHVKHANDRTVIERLADDSAVGSHLGAIAASVGLRNTVLLHERLFVGVEGESEARALPVLFKLATGRHLESCGIAIWPCGNNEGARHFAEFLQKHDRNVVFLVDEDSKANAKHVFSPQKLRSAGLDPDRQCLYVGDPAEIEEVFTDDQWARAANQSWPRPAPEQQAWLASDFAKHRGGKFSKAVLEMIRIGTEETTAPTGKPDMLVGLALSLADPTDVPRDLQEKFQRLIELAK